ncbi:MAG: response regulator [Trichlorobacter sp.]|nr:response regulator [Trichlorobacter sp.]
MFATGNHEQPFSVLLAARPSSRRDELLELLLAEDLHLIAIDDAEETEARFLETMPDVVILLHDEQTDAFSIQTRLRKRWGCRAHCVIVGGNDERTAWQKALQLGLAAYLPEPAELAPLADILLRLRQQTHICVDTSRSLLDASRLTQVFDALPFGVVLIGTGERIVRINKAVDTLLGQSALTAVPHCLEELLSMIFGPSFDEPLVKIRAAIAEGRNWQETAFIGQKLLTMGLVILSGTADSPGGQASCLLSVQDMNPMLPAGDAFRPMLAAAAFDLLAARHLGQRELSTIVSLIADARLTTPETFNLGALLEDCCNNACQDCGSPVNISMEISKNLPDLVSGHPLILREALHALLEWAGAESGNGKITFSTAIQGRQKETVAVRFRIDAVERRLTRSNYRSAEEYITDEFARNGNAALRQLRGIGLASLLTARLGSSLLVRNVAREGKSVSFELWLEQVDAATVPDFEETVQKPVTQIAPARQELPFLLWDNFKVNPDHGQSLRILVAEDNLLEQRSLQAVLDKLGHGVVIVNNGREAVEELEQNSYDLLLLDILMPVMDGFEAIRLIRERELRIGHYTPVLALTSYTLKAVQERCSRAGMNGYLAKPVTVESITLLFNQLRLTDNSFDAAGSTASVLDFDSLGHDKELYQDMLELFKEHGLPLITQLDQLLATGVQDETMHQLVHKLKGMSANIGAETLRRILMELEELTMQNQQFDHQALQLKLKNATQQLMAAVAAIDWQNYPQPA